jgi:hypothetical protein
MAAISGELSASGTSFAHREVFDFVFFRGCPILAGWFCKGGSFVFFKALAFPCHALVFTRLTAHSRHLHYYTIMVHNGVMSSPNKTIRQSVTLPATTAAKVRSLARTRRLSSNRMLVELIENGIEAEKRKQQEFFELAERFRDATDPEEAKRLGDELGRMVFGG